MVDKSDLKSDGLSPCGFESHLSHHLLILYQNIVLIVLINII
jgi:hypothetical protein